MAHLAFYTAKGYYLRALARTLALRFVTLSLSKAVCSGNSSTELCQIQLEILARVALIASHSSIQLLQCPLLVVHCDASARACDLHAHVSCSMASMQLVICY